MGLGTVDESADAPGEARPVGLPNPPGWQSCYLNSAVQV